GDHERRDPPAPPRSAPPPPGRPGHRRTRVGGRRRRARPRGIRGALLRAVGARPAAGGQPRDRPEPGPEPGTAPGAAGPGELGRALVERGSPLRRERNPGVGRPGAVDPGGPFGAVPRTAVTGGAVVRPVTPPAHADPARQVQREWLVTN